MTEWESSLTVHCMSLRFSVKVKAGSSDLYAVCIYLSQQHWIPWCSSFRDNVFQKKLNTFVDRNDAIIMAQTTASFENK